MEIKVRFFSHLKEATGCQETLVTVPDGSSIQDLLRVLQELYIGLKGLDRSLLVAVDVDYQPRNYILHSGDVVALFPPVQGG